MRYFKDDFGCKHHSIREAINTQSNPPTIDEFSVIQLLNFGCVYHHETLFKQITKHYSHQYHRFSKKARGFVPQQEETINLRQRDIVDPKEKFLAYFEQLSFCLQKKNIIVDLTGGVDSRLIAVLLQHFNIKFDCFFDLNAAHKGEKAIVEKVAKKLNKDVIFYKKIDRVNDEDILEALEISDGLWDPFNILQVSRIQKYKKERGYDLVITGVGGGLFKDSWWQQDFPFYGTISPNIKRLIRKRMMGQIQEIYRIKGKAFNIEGDKFIIQFIKSLQKYIEPNNTRTYDQIYYNVRVREQTSLISKISEQYINSYSPLLEQELVEIGFNLKPNKRFFNQFYREIMSDINKEVASMPTSTGGMSVENSWNTYLKDTCKYAYVKSKRAKEVYFGRKQDIDNGSMMLDIEKNAEDLLKAKKFIKSNTDFSKLSENIRGRLLALAWNLSLIEKEDLF